MTVSDSAQMIYDNIRFTKSLAYTIDGSIFDYWYIKLGLIYSTFIIDILILNRFNNLIKKNKSKKNTKMSSMLEKSLDEIIKDAPRQGGKNFRNNNRPRNGPGGIGKNPRGTRGGRFNSHPRYNNNNGRPHHRSGPPHHNSHRSDYKRPHIPKDHEAEELR